MTAYIADRRVHPAVDLDRFDRETIEMVLEHGSVLEAVEGAQRYVYGPLSIVVTDQKLLAVFERDRVNELDVHDYDDLDHHPHFDHRLHERNLYEYEVEDVVREGIRYYQQHTWYYLGTVAGHLVRVIRNGDQLKTVYWHNDSPRDWEHNDETTSAYMRRRAQRQT